MNGIGSVVGKTPDYLMQPLRTFNSDMYASTSVPSIGASGPEVLRIETDGRIFWKGREVESDEEFRTAMMDVRAYFTGSADGMNSEKTLMCSSRKSCPGQESGDAGLTPSLCMGVPT